MVSSTTGRGALEVSINRTAGTWFVCSSRSARRATAGSCRCTAVLVGANQVVAGTVVGQQRFAMPPADGSALRAVVIILGGVKLASQRESDCGDALFGVAAGQTW